MKAHVKARLPRVLVLSVAHSQGRQYKGVLKREQGGVATPVDVQTEATNKLQATQIVTIPGTLSQSHFSFLY